MRTLLFKRLESSDEAFRQTLAGLIERHEIFLRGLDNGFLIAGEEVEDLLKGIEPGDAERDDLRLILEMPMKFGPPLKTTASLLVGYAPNSSFP